MNTATRSTCKQRTSERPFSWWNQAMAFALGGIFALVGSVLLVNALQPLVMWSQSLLWTATPCTIDSASVAVDRNSFRRGVNYLPEIRYHYVCQGQTYQSTRFAWDSASYRNRESIENWLAPYSAGQPSVCYVCPANPEQSVLLQSIPKPALFAALLAGLASAFGFYIIIGALRKKSEPVRALTMANSYPEARSCSQAARSRVGWN